MNQRLFCVLERDAEDLGGSSIVCIDGLSKPRRTAAHARDYRRVRRYGEDSRSGGRCSARPDPSAWGRLEFKIQSPGERDERRERRVRLLRREQTTDRFGFDACAPSQFGFGDVDFNAALIQGPDHGVYLVDSLPSALVCLPVFGIVPSTSEIALRPCRRSGHNPRLA